MKMQTQYSDEMISAYVDGELDEEECALLLRAEQEDSELALRVRECRMLKEQVQLAYANVQQPEQSQGLLKCPALVANYKSLVAGVLVIIALSLGWVSLDSNNSHLVVAKQLMKTTQPLAATSLASAVVNHDKVVVHLSQYQPERFGDILDQVELLLQQRGDNGAIQLEIVANNQGLESMDADTSAHASRLSALAQRYRSLDVVACAKSLADLASSDHPVNLLKSIMTIPAAGKQIAKRLSQGWVYIKI